MANRNYFGWHILYVKSRHEKKVDLVLKGSNMESFLPTFTTIQQWSDRKKKVIKPLFPSYVFVNIRSKMEFTKSLNVKGVFGYLRFGSEYATIKEEEILKIKQFLKLEGISNVDSTSSLPVKGEIMRINTGALDGLTCKVLKINNRNKVFVRIESIRRNITAIVPPEYLSR